MAKTVILAKSPLNGLAAKWADENQHLLPVDPTEVAPPLERPATATAETPSPPEAHEQPPPEPPKPPSRETAEPPADPWASKIVIS